MAELTDSSKAKAVKVAGVKGTGPRGSVRSSPLRQCTCGNRCCWASVVVLGTGATKSSASVMHHVEDGSTLLRNYETRRAYTL